MYNPHTFFQSSKYSQLVNNHIETGRVLKPKSTELRVNTHFNQLVSPTRTGPSAPLAAVLGITGGS